MKWALGLAVAVLAGCMTTGRPPVSEPVLQDEGAVYVYLAPLPFEVRGVSFSATTVAVRADLGPTIPLRNRLPTIGAADQSPGERLLAHGRLPRGRYPGLDVAVDSAWSSARGEKRRLSTPEAPVRVDAPFEVVPGRATVVTLALDPRGTVNDGDAFSPRLTGAVPARSPPQLLGAASNQRTNDVTLFDGWVRTVSSIVATGRTPAGLALDPAVARAWVALSGQDQIEVVDLSRAESLSRIPMRAGDEPRAMQMLPDRRTLLVANVRSQTASFVDGFSTQELARVPVGDTPWSITLQRGGNRAFVLNRRSNTITVVDLGTRQAVGTVATDPEPLFGQVSRDGRRLYVIHAGSPFMIEFALPGLTVTRRIRVGLGAVSIRLDPRTDLLYIGHEEVARLEVYDPVSPMPIDAFDLPSWVSYMAIDDPQDQLFAVMPALDAVAVIDLTSRRLLSVIDLPGGPYEVRLAAERN